MGYTSDSDALLDPIKDKIDAYTNFLVDRMNDASLHVREAAGETVGRFTENFHDDFLDMHAKVMPCLLKVIRDLSGSGKDLPIQKSIFALNEFVAQLDYEIKTYIEDIIQLMLLYIEGDYQRDVKYWALVALSASITTAAKKITPYMDGLLAVFKKLMDSAGSISDQQAIKG